MKVFYLIVIKGAVTFVHAVKGWMDWMNFNLVGKEKTFLRPPFMTETRLCGFILDSVLRLESLYSFRADCDTELRQSKQSAYIICMFNLADLARAKTEDHQCCIYHVLCRPLNSYTYVLFLYF